MTTEAKVLEYPTDQQLLETYNDIEQAANTAIGRGEVTGNPILTGQMPDTRYSVCVQGYILGSPASDFLSGAIRDLQLIEPTIKFVDPQFLHLTLQEVAYSPTGRRPTSQSAFVDAQAAYDYYQALKEGLPTTPDIKLTLHKIFPTLDAPINGTGLRSASVVSSFLTEGDDTLFRIRDEIAKAVTERGLPFSARLGTIRVIFITLGRFTQPPVLSGGEVPILQIIDSINQSIPGRIQAVIDDIDMISTTKASYPYPHGHVFMYPPIPFDRDLRGNGHMEFLRPQVRPSRIQQS